MHLGGYFVVHSRSEIFFTCDRVQRRTICNNYRMIAIGVDQSDPILDSLGFAFFLLSVIPRCMNTCNYRAVNLGGFQRHQSQTTRAPLQNYTLQRFSIEPQSVLSTLSATQRNQTLRQCKDKPASRFMLSCFFGHLSSPYPLILYYALPTRRLAKPGKINCCHAATTTGQNLLRVLGPASQPARLAR